MAEITVYGPIKLGDPAVIVHGGAGSWRLVERLDEVLKAVENGARAGLEATKKNNAIEVVVEAIAALEDSGVLNAGTGSTLTYDGRVEMDAGLMDDDMRAGGVAVVTYPRNPIRLAKFILLNLDHVIIAGKAADELAKKLGLPKHPGPSEASLKRWQRLRDELRKGGGPAWARKIVELYGDTVGAAALVNGRLAAGASTGGVSLKYPGRVGDSPIPGAGFYARRGVAACSATGIGETIILGRPCVYAVDLVAEGVPVEEAARAAVARHTRLFGSKNLGIIVVDANGYAAAAINTDGMPIAYAGAEAPTPTPLMLRRVTGEAER
ncbi:isoaspartyl peptidase/L-asparaginase [Pyrofollis japonicus]|uniref:isoaspartyl peptidase/L-asparaginase n=1 Tax=Pyrofollis japonicus TaxID=3060460 RepID=UPI00295A741A|nr:isoaspartyl peptidase/L-asparaginase [Pyrofollis japonicus]BEP18669.1 isoaspartyl peptidase/L-asparaginase [Pyrofollis japonicus]